MTTRKDPIVGLGARLDYYRPCTSNTDKALQPKNSCVTSAGSESVYTLCRAVGAGTTGPTNVCVLRFANHN